MDSHKQKVFSLTDKNIKPEHGNIEKITQTPSFRQFVICVTVWISYFVTGLIAGSPTPATLAQTANRFNLTVAEINTTPKSDDVLSYIVLFFRESGYAWVVILPLLMDYFGRRTAFVIVNFNIYFLLIIFFFSIEPIHTVINNIVLCLSISCGQSISVTILTEYIDPKYRGIVLSIKTVFFFTGFWISNAIGTFFFSKNIFFIAMACSAYFVLILLCPESPFWLASQGKFKECAISHRWLRGNEVNAEKELESIIESQKDCTKCTTNHLTSFQSLLQSFKEHASPEFYKPCLINMILFLQYYSTGKIIVSYYALQVLAQITEDQIKTYTWLLYFDLFTVFAMGFGCVLTKFFLRRFILLTTSILSISFMLLTSMYLSLIRLNVLAPNELVFLSILLAINLIQGCGPLILCPSLFAELLTLRFKTSMLIILGIYLNVLYTITKALVTIILLSLNATDVFFLYTFLSTVCFILLYKLLPETKDKTLLEIEEYFQGKYTHDKTAGEHNTAKVI